MKLEEEWLIQPEEESPTKKRFQMGESPLKKQTQEPEIPSKKEEPSPQDQKDQIILQKKKQLFKSNKNHVKTH